MVLSVAPFILDLYSRAALVLILTRNFSGVGLFLHRYSHTAARSTTWLDSNDLSWFGLGIFAPFDPNRLGGSDGSLLVLDLRSTVARHKLMAADLLFVTDFGRVRWLVADASAGR